MPIHHDHIPRVRGSSLLGCACLLVLGCASDRETQRRDPSARERSHEHREHAAERDRDLTRAERDRELTRAERLDDHDRVPDATPRTSGEPVGEVKPVAVATPDQGGTEADQQLSARIRKSIADDDRLSLNAKNVTVTSSAEEVTLRGSVATAEEKKRVESYAQRAAGSRHVNNQLEVKN